MVCQHPDHNKTIAADGVDVRCRLTRHIDLTTESLNPAAGRVVGLLATHLLESDNFGSSEEHCDPFIIKAYLWEDRDASRKWLETLSQGRKMMEFERPRRPGESAEPFGDP